MVKMIVLLLLLLLLLIIMTYDYDAIRIIVVDGHGKVDEILFVNLKQERAFPYLTRFKKINEEISRNFKMRFLQFIQDKAFRFGTH